MKNTTRHVFPDFTHFLHMQVQASFTIEASIIIPITFLIIVSLITFACSLHSRINTYNNEIYDIIALAPYDTKNSVLPTDQDYINIENLNGRQTLLRYKLARDGVKYITGGLTDED